MSTTDGARAPLTIRYNAGDRSYTLQSEGRSQVFTAADRQPDRFSGEARYVVTDGRGSTDYLTLALASYEDGTPYRYVGLGYWQADKSTIGRRDVDFYTFTYGYETPSAALVRSGSASWDTDIFGLLTRPGEFVRTMEGTGRFDVDFGQGVFSTTGEIREFEYVGTGGSGTIEMWANGVIGSDGRLAGTAGYNGVGGGQIAGAFYGPSFEELGATFHLENEVGHVLTGAMLGRKNGAAGPPPRNMTLVNLVASELLLGQGWSYGRADGVRVDETGPRSIHFLEGGQISDLTPNSAQSQANFTRYSGTGRLGEPVEVDFYKAGTANSELALTYLSYATWVQPAGSVIPGGGTIAYDHRAFLLYGIETAPYAIQGLTGTSNYEGLVLGNGRTEAGALYNIGGSSQFQVNFGAGTYSGALLLTGTDRAGARHDFGRYAFTSTLNGSGMDVAFLVLPAGDLNQTISSKFYGPLAQEIGATFNVRTGDYFDPATVHINGVALAKQVP